MVTLVVCAPLNMEKKSPIDVRVLVVTPQTPCCTILLYCSFAASDHSTGHKLDPLVTCSHLAHHLLDYIRVACHSFSLLSLCSSSARRSFQTSTPFGPYICSTTLTPPIELSRFPFTKPKVDHVCALRPRPALPCLLAFLFVHLL